MTAGFRIVKEDPVDFRLVFGVENGCGRDSAVCPQIVTDASGYFGIESKTFRRNQKSQPYAWAGFNKFPCRDMMFVYFFASCSGVRSGWAVPTNKEVSAFCLCCVGSSPLSEEVMCHIWISLVDTLGNCLLGCCSISGLLRWGWATLQLNLRVSGHILVCDADRGIEILRL